MANYQNVTYQTRVFAERVLTLKGKMAGKTKFSLFEVTDN